MFRGLREVRFFFLVVAFLGSSFVFSKSTLADDYNETISTPRFTLHMLSRESAHVAGEPILNDIAERSINILNDTYSELTRILATKPNRKVVLRFLSQKEFKDLTGAPAWTNAMYFRGEITIPLNMNHAIDLDELKRALRHEYVHAVVAELSNYRCPAWLDEGLAQLIEGDPNPLLGPGLRRWISQNEAMPLDWLQNGFTTLNADIVPAAYAQSLFSTRTLVNQFGFDVISSYLKDLGSGMNENTAFEANFKRSKHGFEQELSTQISRWATSGQQDP